MEYIFIVYLNLVVCHQLLEDVTHRAQNRINSILLQKSSKVFVLNALHWKVTQATIVFYLIQILSRSHLLIFMNRNFSLQGLLPSSAIRTCAVSEVSQYK